MRGRGFRPCQGPAARLAFGKVSILRTLKPDFAGKVFAIKANRETIHGTAVLSTRSPQLRLRPPGGGRIVLWALSRLVRRRRSPTPRSRVGRGGCTDLVSSTPEHRREGRWCLG